MTTVFRSLDETAEEEARRVRDLLVEHGVYAVLLDDSAPGVVSGTYEVRVPASESVQAEALLQAEPEVEDETSYEPVDPSHYLDLETVFSAEGATAELEATAVKSILDANQIPAVLSGSSTLPVLRFEVQVPMEAAAEARQTIADAEEAGPAAAEEAERATERPL